MRRMIRKSPLFGSLLLFAFALALLSPTSASAFTTRTHIVFANQVRASLIASGDGTIDLAWSDGQVQLPMEDADAIVNQPLAFRAGAIGPDNMVFPGMTDGSHAIDQDPYRQCQLLYDEAVTERERAYSLGCFLHGATDAVAHHFVNYFTGETFTLTPLSSSRLESFTNVVGHIVTESAIQSAFYESDPSAFDASSLNHTLPTSFVRRTYYDTNSPVWQRLSRGAVAKWEAARAAAPDGTLLDWATAAGFAGWEHVAMAPLYVMEAQRLRAELRTFIEGEVADLSDASSTRGSTLGVSAGSDGVIGTPDDDTSCSVSCPELYGRYYVLVNLLAPRYDAGGRELPSAFDKISEQLGDDLNLFLPALIETINNMSAQLNAPVTDSLDHGFDVAPGDVTGLFTPIDEWASRTTRIDYETLGRAVTPTWYQGLSDFFAGAGLSISIPSILSALLSPYVEEVRDALIGSVRDEAYAYISELTQEYRDTQAAWVASVDTRLDESAPPGLGGNALDFVQQSGLRTYAFNITAATLANHEVLLSPTDATNEGAASFDASHTLSWTQLGLCDYLAEQVFPRGLGVDALLSVDDGTFRASPLTVDSPIECHDGALESFGTPSAAACRLVAIDELLVDPRGSLSRAYPPLYASDEPACRRLTVPGLPPPPPIPDAGPGELDASTPGGDAGPGADGGAGSDAGSGPGDAGDCACSAPGAQSGQTPAPWLLLAGFLSLLLWRGRRRLARAAAALALGALLVVGCGTPMDSVDGSMPEDGSTTDGGMDSGPGDAGPDAGPSMVDAGFDAAPLPDAGPDLRRELLDALGTSVWSATLERSEGAALRTRAYEMRFDASTLEWAEIRNPWGPARQRILRSFNIDRDGLTVNSIVMIPSGWETPPTLNGDRDTWTFEVMEGTPRTLRITNMESGVVEVFEEGAYAAPVTGLTAEVRVFGGTGAIHAAFCGATTTSFERRPIWEFARGRSITVDVGHDVVAGVGMNVWNDSSRGANDFGITDVSGFDMLGGTELSDTFNFVVRYTGTITHPGGELWMREGDDERNRYTPDAVEDALWVFIGDGVGGGTQFLEVHGYAAADATDDEVGMTFPAGDIPIEIIMVRCAMPFDDGGGIFGSGLRDMAAMISSSASGPWELISMGGTAPDLDMSFFPPAL